MTCGAGEQNRGLDATAQRIREPEVQFAAGALAEERRDARDENQDEFLHDKQAREAPQPGPGRASSIAAPGPMSSSTMGQAWAKEFPAKVICGRRSRPRDKRGPYALLFRESVKRDGPAYGGVAVRAIR